MKETEKMVPSEGVEPPCLAALGSKPSVSANSTNWAQTKTMSDSCIQKKLKKQKLL
jgi:hypothetical protein